MQHHSNRTRPRTPSLARPTLGVVLLASGLALGAGCSSTGPVGDSGLNASYSVRTLTLDLASPVEPATAAAAAEGAMRDLGLTITDRSVSGRGATITARRPGDGLFDGATVNARPEGAGTRLKVSVGPFGDETLSYALMDAMMVRLGR